MTQEELEQGVLARGEGNRFPGDRDLVGFVR